MDKRNWNRRSDRTHAGPANAAQPSESWLFAQAILGNPVPSASASEADARAKREYWQWLADILPEHERQMCKHLSREDEAHRQRELLEWLACISQEHEYQLHALLRAEAEERERQQYVQQPGNTLLERTWDPSKHPKGAFPQNRGWWSPTTGTGGKAGVQAISTPVSPHLTPADPIQTTHDDVARRGRSGSAFTASFHSAAEPDILNPASQNSVSRAFWEALRRGDWKAAEDVIKDIANVLDKAKLQNIKTALKRIRGLDAWRKQALRWTRKRILQEIKTFEKTLAKHLSKRRGVDTAETTRIRYQILYLKGLLK
jgi:hypothetical protein